MSKSSTGTSEKGPDPSSALKLEQKKTKVLKKALKEERALREGIKAELTGA